MLNKRSGEGFTDDDASLLSILAALAAAALDYAASAPVERYFALRDLLDRLADDPKVVAAQAEVMRTGPVPAIPHANYPDLDRCLQDQIPP